MAGLRHAHGGFVSRGDETQAAVSVCAWLSGAWQDDDSLIEPALPCPPLDTAQATARLRQSACNVSYHLSRLVALGDHAIGGREP